MQLHGIIECCNQVEWSLPVGLLEDSLLAAICFTSRCTLKQLLQVKSFSVVCMGLTTLRWRHLLGKS